MGIPIFASWLRGRVEFTAAYNRRAPDAGVDILAVDLNGIIHPVVGQYGERSFDKMIAKVASVAKSWRARKIILVIDGVAPMAKMVHQRKNRMSRAGTFSSVVPGSDLDDSNGTAVFNLNTSKPMQFDTSQISPGTNYIRDLESYISSQGALIRRIAPTVETVVFSSCFSPGEGEHKIVDMIKEEIPRRPGFKISVAIHSNDADMVFLGILLTRLRHVFNVWIIKENFDRNSVDTLDTRFLASLVDKYLAQRSKERPATVYDFAFVVPMAGNDFIPRFHHMKLLRTGFDYILDALGDHGEIVSRETLAVDWMSFVGFLEHFQSKYGTLLEKRLADLSSGVVDEREERLSDRQGQRREQGTKFSVDLIGFDGMDPESNSYRIQWYKKAFTGTSRGKAEISEKDVGDMCRRYLQAFLWVHRYYNHGANSVSKNWYYPYHYPPTIRDFIRYTRETIESGDRGWEFDVSMSSPDFASIPEQLAYILPNSARFYLPAELVPIYDVDSPLGFMFPKTCPAQTTGMAAFYESIIFAPIPDPRLVNRVVSSLEKPPELLEIRGNLFI